MRDRILAAFFLATVVAVIESPAQTAPTGLFPAYTAPRTGDGKPNLNGIWQSLTTANWDIQAHGAQPGPHPEIMGAWGAAPGGQSIVEGGEVPYRPEALATRKQNFENRMSVKVTNDPHRYDTGEPELQCYRPGVPRANYMPFPFQIFQTPSEILIAYEFKGDQNLRRSLENLKRKRHVVGARHAWPITLEFGFARVISMRIVGDLDAHPIFKILFPRR